MSKEYSWEKIKNIVEGDDAEKIYQQLIFAGLFLLVLEQFKRMVINRVDCFFSDSISLENDKIIYKRGEEFKRIIKNRGHGEKFQHKNDVFRASLRWFQDFGVISKEECDEVERLYLIRNDVGHELFGIIVDDNKEVLKIEDARFILRVYVKIIKWWIKEIEGTTNPFFILDEEDMDNLDAAETGETLLLKAILDKVTAKFGTPLSPSSKSD